MANQCVICASKIKNGAACHDCIAEFVSLVCDIGVSDDRRLCLLDELDIQISRQNRNRDALASVSRSANRALPYDPRAAMASTALAASLAKWAWAYGAKHDAYPIGVAIGAPRACARWMALHDRALRSDIRTGHAYRDLAKLANTARGLIDRQRDKWYAGTCGRNGCMTDLYADPDRQSVQCPVCGTVHNVADRRAALLDAVGDVLATATEIARAVHLHNAHLTVAMINGYVFRGRLIKRGRNPAGETLYRVGDVIDIVQRITLDH